MPKIKHLRREHPGWRELQIARKYFPCPRVIGRYQHIYTSPRGRMSMIYIPEHIVTGKGHWEIYCQKGNVIEDLERYPTKKKAEDRIKNLLAG